MQCGGAHNQSGSGGRVGKPMATEWSNEPSARGRPRPFKSFDWNVEIRGRAPEKFDF